MRILGASIGLVIMAMGLTAQAKIPLKTESVCEGDVTRDFQHNIVVVRVSCDNPMGWDLRLRQDGPYVKGNFLLLVSSDTATKGTRTYRVSVDPRYLHSSWQPTIFVRPD